MRKLTKRELTQELRTRAETPIYECAIKWTWRSEPSTVLISANTEIEAARIIREQHCGVEKLYSITLREDLKVWA